jgi:enamine deaminase RidA (YjgF/YER057c/UK114 family)
MYFLPPVRPGNMGMSRGVRVGNRVFVSCCAPRWPEGTTGVATHDPLVQARRCWEIILGALHEGAADIEHVTRVRMFIRHAADAEPMARFTNEVFGEHRPALTVLPIRGYLRPEWRVEMEAEAII